ncbi:uncharacterized protein A1O9_01649 [Exophiala aquamarina CBS 119918]|uniref:Uncharacterized protein n=1 Tax=Exophiala aquamarina CBS 119918 TaxID=1182545 RepID=A0A072PUZ0_9EURO|nr:uncharacterized protein A1O9_01649 [Exophiala aquamarina CBS 119918]KEF63671.1 hypothetical protein A1O9_01649 [Exophiala aquamarina CBS 119918]
MRHYRSASVKILGKGQRDLLAFLLDQIQLRETDTGMYASLIEKAARPGSCAKLSVIVNTVGGKCDPRSLARCCTEFAAKGNATAPRQVLPVILKYLPEYVKTTGRFQNLQHMSIGDAVTRLLSGTMRKSKEEEGRSLRATFQLAAYRGNIDVLSGQLKMGMDINNMNGLYGTALLSLVSDPTTANPLHFAAAEMQVETVQVLIKAGADVTAKSSSLNSFFRQETISFQEEEAEDLEDFGHSSRAPWVPDRSINCDNTFENTTALYTPQDAIQRTESNYKETDVDMSFMPFEEYLTMDETHQTSNEITPSSYNGKLQNNPFPNLSPNLFTIP